MTLGAYFTYELNNQFLHLNIWITLIGGSLAMGGVVESQSIQTVY